MARTRRSAMAALVGSGLTWRSEISGDITVTASQERHLTGNGNDAYGQIGHGGGQMNTNAGAKRTARFPATSS